MNILVLTDGFYKGGLETHIDTYYNELKKDNNIIFGFSNYKEAGYLNNAKIVNDFKFSYASSIDDFINDVEKIVGIIKEYNIDVVHVHPFYAIYPAIFAANITGTKLVYTYHGRASINFFQDDIDSLLFQFAIENFIQKIFCVSYTGVKWINSFYRNQAVLMPNIINENVYKEKKYSNNKRWALVSRLDSDKEKEIIEFLKMLPKLDINIVDIYGDGGRKDYIEKYITENNLSSKINLKGYVSNLNKELNDYTGIIGLGRVAIESLTMNYPTLLIGYGKIYGIIDKKMYSYLKNENFVPTELCETRVEDLNKQLKIVNNKSIKIKEFLLRSVIVKDMGIKKVKEYIDNLNDITPISLTVINDIYDNLKKIEDKNQLFYSSIDVKKILIQFIGFYSNNPNIKDKLNLIRNIISFESSINLLVDNLNSEVNLLRMNNKEIVNSLEDLNDNYSNLEKKYNILQNKYGKLKENFDKLDDLFNKLNSKQISNDKILENMQNTSFLTLIKRDFSKLIYNI